MDRLINWTEVEEWMHRQHETTEQWSMRIAIENYVDAMPEAVVRCKDCAYPERSQPGMVYCPNIVGGWVDDNGYCAWGERREG